MGSAWQENERYMANSIEAQKNLFKAQWQNMVLSMPFEDLEKAVFKAGTAILKFVNSDIGALIAKQALVTAGVVALGKAFNVLNAKGLLSLPNIIAKVTSAVETLTATCMANPLIAGTAIVAAASVAIITAFKKEANAAHELSEKAKELGEQASQSANNVQTLTSQLKDIDSQIKDINDKELTVADVQQTAELEKQKQALQEQKEAIQLKLKLEQETLATLRQQTAEAAKQAMNKMHDKGYSSYKMLTDDEASTFQSDETINVGKKRFASVDVQYDNVQDEIRGRIKDFNDIKQAITEAQEEQSKLNSSTQEYADKQRDIDNLKEQLSNTKDILTEYAKNVLAIVEAGGEEANAYKDIAEALSNYLGLANDAQDTKVPSDESLTNTKEAKNETESLEKTIENAVGSLQSMQSAYSTLSNAVQEYNSQGSLSADTLANLTKLSSDQIACLEMHNGKLTLNTQLLNNQFEAEKQVMINKLEDARDTELLALAHNTLNASALNATSGLSQAGTQADATGKHFDALSGKASALANILNTIFNQGKATPDFNKQFKAIQDKYNKMIDEIKNTKLQTPKAIGGGGGGGGHRKGGGHKGGGGGGSSSDSYLESFKKEQAELKHQLEMDEITQSEYYDKLDKLNEKYFGKASGRSSKYVEQYKQNQEEIYKGRKQAYSKAFDDEKNALKDSLDMNEITEIEYYEKLEQLNEKYFGQLDKNHKQYAKEYKKNEEEIYKGTKQVYDKVKNYLQKAVEKGYERAINAIKEEEKQAVKEIENQINALKKQKDEVIKGIEKQISGLKKHRTEVEKYWDAQINKIKEQNEQIEKQNQMLEYQKQLEEAKAQKVMVMKGGKFQLGEDTSAVEQAENALNTYTEQQASEQRIQELERLKQAQLDSIDEQIEKLQEYKDYMSEYYDNQIEALEQYKEETQARYEEQIDNLQKQLDTFKEGYQKAEDLENARLTAEVMASNEEASVWQKRLENLSFAISQYNALLSQLGKGGKVSSKFKPSNIKANLSAQVAGIDSALTARASGDANFKRNEIALVGESPNTEMIIGSQLNQSINGGKLLHLAKGSGIVNAESTSTLAGLLNGIKPNDKYNKNATQQVFNFGSISLPNVTDSNSFVHDISNRFNNYSIQFSNKRQ
jgi:DNA repair exonuclease SbcCD ATPase subunit